jgi:hypothetical protein
MAAISQKVVGLIGGVSQQPDSLKLDGFFRECINYYPDPTFGLLKRPGIKLIKALDAPVEESSWFFIAKSKQDKYAFQVTRDGEVRLFDAQSGHEYTINTPASSATDYATHTDKAELEIFQINDYVFFLNRLVRVEEGATTSAAQDNFGYLLLETVAYDTQYKVKLNGSTLTYTTPTSSGSNLSAETIVSGITSQINGLSGFTATGVGNAIYVARTTGAEFSMEASGGLAGTGLRAYKGTIDTVDQLPAQFVNNKIIRIAADKNSTGDDYFVKFETSDGGSAGAGVWKETLGPGVKLGLDPSTMPHALIQEADGTFSFRELSETAAGSYTLSTSVAGIPTTVSVVSNSHITWDVGQTFAAYGGTGFNLRLRVEAVDANGQITSVSIARAGQDYTALDQVNNAEGDVFQIDTVVTDTISGDTWADQYWKDRVVGDEETNPSPTFVGKRITGISFFKNRLVLMSGENVICSQASQFFDFFASTVVTQVDNDPIDISAGSLLPIELRYALQQPSGLILFADNSQYILQTKTEAFSIKSAELNLLSSFTQSGYISPVNTGVSLVFVEEGQKATTVTEMQLNGDQTPYTETITKIIPSYIPSAISDFKGTISASLFALKSKNDERNLYLFRHHTRANERLMASWFKWQFPAPVVLYDFYQDEVTIVIKGDTGYVLGHINLLTEQPGGAIEFDDQYYDLRLDLFDYNPDMSYDAVNDVTKVFFKENCDISAAQPCLVTITPNNAGNVQYLDLEYDALAPVGEQYYVETPGDVTTENFCLGYQINSHALLPNFYVAATGDRTGSRKDTLNIPVVHRAYLYSNNSGPFTAVLDVIGRDTFTLQLPQITSDVTFANDVPMLRTAENIIPIMASGKYIELQLNCDAPFPLSFVTMNWEGTYNNKGIKAV